MALICFYNLLLIIMIKKADLSKLELAVEPVISMNRANEDILLHEGIFFISKSFRIELKGSVYFSWLPELQVRFQGIAENYLTILYYLMQKTARFCRAAFVIKSIIKSGQLYDYLSNSANLIYLNKLVTSRYRN